MAENEGGSAAVGESPTLVSFAADMFGDFSHDEPESDDTGTPPVETPDPASSEGEAGAEPPGEPPGEAAPDATPDSSTTSPTSDPDPLEGASPLAYMVDGQERTYDGITVLKDGGAIVDPEKVADIQRKLGERDHLFETNQAQYRQLTALEKAIEWRDGDKTITGAPALEAQRVYISQAAEAIKAFASILTPQQFAKYVSIGQNPDGTYYVEPDKAALESFRERLQFITDRAAFEARKGFAPLASSFPAQPTPVTDTTPVESLAADTVAAMARAINATLSDESKAFLASQLPRFVRPTRPEERAQYGARIVDESFHAVVAREARQVTNTAKIAETASAAAKANAARLAAASPKPNGKQPQKLTTPKEPVRTRADDFDDAFTRQEKAAAGALRAHAGGLALR